MPPTGEQVNVPAKSVYSSSSSIFFQTFTRVTGQSTLRRFSLNVDVSQLVSGKTRTLIFFDGINIYSTSMDQ